MHRLFVNLTSFLVRRTVHRNKTKQRWVLVVFRAIFCWQDARTIGTEGGQTSLPNAHYFLWRIPYSDWRDFQKFLAIIYAEFINWRKIRLCQEQYVRRPDTMVTQIDTSWKETIT